MSCNFQQKKALRISESEGGADGARSPGERGGGQKAGQEGPATEQTSTAAGEASRPPPAQTPRCTTGRLRPGQARGPASSLSPLERNVAVTKALWPLTDLRSASLYKELGPRKSQLRLGVNLGIRVVRGMLEGNYLQTHREMSITFLHFLLN